MSAQKIVKALLLTALPASGKSELRRFMENLTEDEARDVFHLGPTIQLDDFPYVHMMRRIDEELYRRGEEGLFFWDPERPFRNPIDWGTLIHLLNEDYEHLLAGGSPATDTGRLGEHLLLRFERARLKARGPAFIDSLGDSVNDIAGGIEDEAWELFNKKMDLCRSDLTGKTVVIEFARGGPDGALNPLPAPLGYQYSFSQCSPKILRDAAVLYIWVDPEESRRKNRERTDKSDPGSILHHGVPEEVMYHDYGCDDIGYLIGQSGSPNRLRVVAQGKVYLLPAARFDNRVDKTTFLRGNPKDWPSGDLTQLYEELKRAMDALVQ